MNALSIMVGMAENNAFSNARLLRACAELNGTEYMAERTSFFPSLHKTLQHILLVDWYYTDALVKGGRGRSVFDDVAHVDRFEALHAAQLAADKKLVAYVRALRDGRSAAQPGLHLDEAALDERVVLQRKDCEQIETVGDVLLHLFEHQIHHRGQAHAMLAGTRIAPPPLDEYFLASDAPAREIEMRQLGLR